MIDEDHTVGTPHIDVRTAAGAADRSPPVVIDAVREHIPDLEVWVSLPTDLDDALRWT